jgi:uncharacterized delta-60 repeat protein
MMYSDFAVARYNTDGSPDNSFDLDGLLWADISGDSDYANDIAMQGNNMVIVGSSIISADQTSFSVVRLVPDGHFDGSFNGSGTLMAYVESYPGPGYVEEVANAVVIQDDDKIVVGGYTHFNYENYNFGLVRLNNDGSFDTEFDTDGRLMTNFNGTSQDMINDLEIQADGKIVVVGTTDVLFAAARYHLEEEVCPSFATATQNENTLTADQATATYQWLDCSNGYAAITGEINQSFVATIDGNYAVEITLNGCVDTTTCFTVFGLGLENVTETNVRIFPNPAKEQLTITVGGNEPMRQYAIYTTTGACIAHVSDLNTSSEMVDLTTFENGIYFIRIETENGWTNFKLVKN